MKSKNSAHTLAVDCIYTALVQLMEVKPYSEITITDITQKAGVSRMAYYRNYKDKDDILLRRMELRFQEYHLKLNSRKKMTETKLLKEIVITALDDPIIDSIIKAELFGKALPILKKALIDYYTEVFDYDLTDNSTMLLLYKKIGGIMGYMMYLIDFRDSLDIAEYTEYLKSLAD